MRKEYESWLKAQGYKTSTITQLVRHKAEFTTWLGAQDIGQEKASYKEILQYIKHLNFSNTNNQVRRKTGNLRTYYRYLIAIGKITHNPAIGIHPKGKPKMILGNFIKRDTLEKVYQSYPNKTPGKQRNKVMLGILIYQGITTAELQRLTPKDLDLQKGNIYITGFGKTNGRTLRLEAFQILELQHYLDVIRLQMLKNIKGEYYKITSGRKPNKINVETLKNQLFFSESGSENIRPVLLHLFRELKKQDSQIRNATGIRQSTIAHWLKSKDLREVQYLAGHRYVSTTERYQEKDLEALQNALQKYYPLT